MFAMNMFRHIHLSLSLWAFISQSYLQYIMVAQVRVCICDCYFRQNPGPKFLMSSYHCRLLDQLDPQKGPDPFKRPVQFVAVPKAKQSSPQ